MGLVRKSFTVIHTNNCCGLASISLLISDETLTNIFLFFTSLGDKIQHIILWQLVHGQKSFFAAEHQLAVSTATCGNLKVCSHINSFPQKKFHFLVKSLCGPWEKLLVKNPPTGGWETKHMLVLSLQLLVCESKEIVCIVSGG